MTYPPNKEPDSATLAFIVLGIGFAALAIVGFVCLVLAEDPKPQPKAKEVPHAYPRH